MADIKNIDVFQTVTSVSFEVEPNTDIININKVTTSGYSGVPNLQEVTNQGATTTNSITANSFVKSGGTSAEILAANGSVITAGTNITISGGTISSTGGGGGGATNLTTSQTASNFTINSDTGDDAVVPLGNGTLAGATLNNYTTTEKNKLAAITGTNTGDQDLQSVIDNGSTADNANVILSSEGGNTLILSGGAGGTGTLLVYTGDESEGAIASYATDGTAIRTYNNTGIGEEINQGLTSKGLVINSGTSSTGNFIELDKNGVDKLVVNQAGELTATKLIKQGGTSSEILAADGSVITAGTNITITGGQISSVGGSGGGGSSVNYYLNGGTSQGTFGGTTYYEFSKTAVIGTGADFNISTNGYIASFITDVADPSLLLIPAGNWNLEFFFSSSSAGGSPSFYTELYKYDGTTFTLIASSSAAPEGITNGTAIDAYFTALAVPETVLTVNDRLAIRVYVNASGKTITLHTQNGHLCEVITTFTAGLTALNGLQAQVQNFVVGTTGTDFAINSSGSTHTFNLPSASATARGVVTTASQTFAGDKTFIGTIYATSENDYAISAISTNSDGLSVESTNGNGVVGVSINGMGGIFVTTNNANIAQFQTGFDIKAAVKADGTFAGTGLNASGQTINTIASFDANKNVVSLSTATYPSLTELTLLKGVSGSSVQTQLDGKVDENTAITGATKTKITYDAKGLVTAGADATTADIADSTNKRYVTDANLVVIGNTSGTNTGDNATNTQYSGLAASKQDTLQSTVNIKSINGNTILGSGNLTITATAAAQSPFTMLANNSDVTAIPLQQVFKDIGEQTYSLSPAFTGTAPTTISSSTYKYNQTGSLVTVRVNLIYTTAGSITQVVIPLPTDMPTPLSPTGLSGALDVLYYGVGMFSTLTTTVSTVNRVCFLRRNAANTGYEFVITHSAAISSRVISLTLQYFT